MSCSTIKMPKASLPTCKGVAAIEFSLVFLIIFVIFYGLVTFADVFFKMQAVSRAAEDGAISAEAHGRERCHSLECAERLGGRSGARVACPVVFYARSQSCGEVDLG